eukprot:2873605-Rhodomonas_salina.1
MEIVLPVMEIVLPVMEIVLSVTEIVLPFLVDMLTRLACVLVARKLPLEGGVLTLATRKLRHLERKS